MKRLKEQKSHWKTILKVLVFFLFLPIKYVITAIPRNQKIWIFGTTNGKIFADNPKYLFQWVASHQPSITPIWITKNSQLRNAIRENGYLCYHAYEAKGIYYSLISKVWIFSHTTSDINHWLSFGATKINLWHGTPLKKILFDCELAGTENSFYQRLKQKILNPGAFSKPTLLMAASKHVADIMESAWRLNNCALKITGYPRNDILFREPRADILQEITQNPNPPPGPYIIYLPTFRRNTTGNYETDWTIIQTTLKKYNARLLIKLHPFDTSGFDTSDLPNIYFLESSIDIYEILPLTSALITDYSSIAFDYMLLDRPIIYYAYDLDDYTSNERDFYSPFEEVAAGPIAKNTTELIEHIEREVLLGKDSLRPKRQKIAKIYNAYFDGNSSARVYGEINSFLYGLHKQRSNNKTGEKSND